MAVGEDDGGQLVLVVQEVAAMQVGDGNLVLTPEFEGAIERCLSTVRTIAGTFFYDFSFTSTIICGSGTGSLYSNVNVSR